MNCVELLQQLKVVSFISHTFNTDTYTRRDNLSTIWSSKFFDADIGGTWLDKKTVLFVFNVDHFVNMQNFSHWKLFNPTQARIWSEMTWQPIDAYLQHRKKISFNATFVHSSSWSNCSIFIFSNLTFAFKDEVSLRIKCWSYLKFKIK